jgi:hypothetical protein
MRKHLGWDDRSAFSHRLLRRRLPTSGQNGIGVIVIESNGGVGVAGGALRARHHRNLI